MNPRNVLTENGLATSKECRRAVARIVRDLQAQHELTDCDFAEAIGCSIGTVRNARNEETDLCNLWLARIEQRFGAGSIDPYLAIVGSRSIAITSDPSLDALPSTTAAIHSIAVARSPGSPGGERITHGELLAMEPELDAAIKALCALKARCDEVRAA